MQITYQDLKLCATLAREAEDMSERIQRLRAMLERTTTTIKDMPGGGGGCVGDKMADSFAKLDEWEREAGHRTEVYLDHAWIVERAILALPDDRHRLILRLRYLDGLTWEEISDKSNYDERWCRRLHKKGLAALGITFDP